MNSTMNTQKRPVGYVGALVLLGVILILALAGCAANTLAQVPPSPTSGQPAPASPPATNPVRPVLVWEGQLPSPSDGSLQCSRLELDAGAQARLGECNSTGQAKQLFANRDKEWAQIQARFAPFEYRSATDHLVFNGTGSIAGADWQRAILSWIHTTYSELSSGRVSASVRTQMSWVVGPVPGQPDRCAHLVVLNFGYAFADTIPCQGSGQAQDSQGGWLEPAEMSQFDAWLYSRAGYSQDATYFQGAGEQPVSEKDVQEMAAWAKTVYARLKP